MKIVSVFCWVFLLVSPVLALDREAFTFTNYKLDVRVEPEQHRLGVRGRITLRNDSAAPQKSMAVQVSSTLKWRSVQVDGKNLEFADHEFTSDIDHTGALSEAIVTLAREIPPKGTIDLDIGYEGVVLPDATRFTRIGMPEDKARHIDWDEISKAFSAVRGIGNVAWYPIAAEAASLSNAESVPEVVGRWKTREADATMEVTFQSTSPSPVFFSGTREPAGGQSFRMDGIGSNVPTFVIADYQKLMPKIGLSVQYLAGQQDAADDYAEVAAQLNPITPIGGSSERLDILALPDLDAQSFVTEGMLLAPLKAPLTNAAELDMVYALARQLVVSPRWWIVEGLAHYAQAAFIDGQKGRQAALDYLSAHGTALADAEKQNSIRPSGWEDKRSMVNGPDDVYLQTKAMFVWWMLRDMLETLPTEALTNYHPGEDKDSATMQHLIEKQTHRDLQWFFDDWVYHDRGLPDFHVESVFSRPIESGGFLVTITVENLGNAGAEVPVVLQYDGGEIRRRMEVRAKSKASVRIETPGAAQQVTINDASVPESDVTNNVYKVPVAK